MSETKPTRYARLCTINGEALVRKDRIVSIELIRINRPAKYNREDVKVVMWVQTDDANAHLITYFVPTTKAYNDFLGEVFDA